jgi:quinoprotein glucose dehydrogenase
MTDQSSCPTTRAIVTVSHPRHSFRAGIVVAALAGYMVATSAPALAQSPDASDWGYYGGDSFGQRFSSLDEINRKNVAHLTVAWIYRTGENGAGFARASRMSFEATPILGFGLLYLETPTNIVIALDPETGVERWRFNPHIDRARSYAEASSRGVSIWEDPDPKRQGPCTRRVFTGTLDARLLALDAGTGAPCSDFGRGGEIDLTSGLRIRDRPDYLVTSPPAIHGNVVVVGSAIGDNRAADVERGVVRAFDAHTGTLLWSFDPP